MACLPPGIGPAFPVLMLTAWRLLQVGRTWGGGCWGCFVTEETSFLQPLYKVCYEYRHDPRPRLAGVAPAVCPSEAGTPARAPYGSCSSAVQSPGPTRVIRKKGPLTSKLLCDQMPGLSRHKARGSVWS